MQSTTALAIACLLFPALPAPAEEEAAKPEPLLFSAIGCGPYHPADVPAARFYIARENALQSSAFIVHLGDICTGSAARQGKAGEELYARTKTLLTEGSTIPTYIVPGDNEWNDRPDPDVGWAYWTKHLLRLEENFKPEWKTQRQEVRDENFAFMTKDVLVIGINLPGGRIHDHEEWTRRFRENNDWIEAQFTEHAEDARAAVICAQANVIGQGKVAVGINLLFAPFRVRFGELAAKFGKPVLFLHSDGHNWTLDKPWEKAPNITRIQIDLLNAKFPPLQITVDPDADPPFRPNRRLKDKDWDVPK